MLTRKRGYLLSREAQGCPPESLELEQLGYTLLQGVLKDQEVQALRNDINKVFDEYQRDNRAADKRAADDDEMFRYEMLNRSAIAQETLSNPHILAVIECLLGEDCHVIANTAWRNPANNPGDHGGQAWHIDAGPHIPLPDGINWPADIPHPVFAIGVHVYLQDCNMEDGPTGVIPGSHLSGRFPPRDRALDENLSYAGEKVVPLLARAGDIGLFVSDVWHRRLPTGPGDSGRFFLQIHYGRRDIAQRLHSTRQTNQLSQDAIRRASTDREKTVIGLHKPYFYDG